MPDEPAPTPPPRRRPGAQPGNDNALKHGFYARHLPARDTAGLDDLPLDALDDEITLLRILVRRVAEKTGPHQSLEESMSHLRLVTFALTCLARLMRTQTYIGINPPREDPMGELLSQAIQQVNDEWAASRASEVMPAEPSSENNGEQYSPLELF